MIVLSLFDGVSCAMIALKRAGFRVDKYYACEIDDKAIKISKDNYPTIIQLGSVVDFKPSMITEQVDLLIGGSPCVDLSIMKHNRKGLEGDKSSLFYEYLRIMKEVKPRYFVLENVASMKQSERDIITKEMGVEPVLFNASLLSAQLRKRYFWTNIKFELPKDKNILLKDIIQNGKVNDYFMGKNGKALCLTSAYNKKGGSITEIEKCKRGKYKLNFIIKDGAEIEDDNITQNHIRKLSPIECERLQGIPDDYTSCVANTYRYIAIGNAFNCDVVSHILNNMDFKFIRNKKLNKLFKVLKE